MADASWRRYPQLPPLHARPSDSSAPENSIANFLTNLLVAYPSLSARVPGHVVVPFSSHRCILRGAMQGVPNLGMEGQRGCLPSIRRLLSAYLRPNTTPPM